MSSEPAHPAHTSDLETPEHQEWRSRQALSLSAVLKTTFGVGLIFFYMSGGSPWSTAGTMNMVMGRDVQWSFWSLLFGHFAVAFLYTLIIAWVIYRLPTLFAVATGVAVGLGLYVANYLIFRASGGMMYSIEFVTFFAHLTFSLFASVVYKALSVPPPLRHV